MKPNSVSGILCLVEDLDASIEFYKKLGFDFKKQTPGVSAHAYLNWFWIELLLKDKTVVDLFTADVDISPKGAGQYTHLKVDSADEYHDYLVSKGVTPTTQPQDFPWGHREFIVTDPDGYKLVFFQKK